MNYFVSFKKARPTYVSQFWLISDDSMDISKKIIRHIKIVRYPSDHPTDFLTDPIARFNVKEFIC
ncbi:11609_t:CDS:2 [Gigaspora margarita]|uniref:11609_t:CDS:1 n=1 Tax=Gigaspora margarita TaxID=4874 RepID=A0ABM8VZK5_GIGMA|nr:11609_t:CDS:2 [Gigaspora margarita]